MADKYIKKNPNNNKQNTAKTKPNNNNKTIWVKEKKKAENRMASKSLGHLVNI